MFYVYAITSKKEKRIYVGFTNNLQRRIREHNRGKTKTTKYYCPWELLYSEKVSTRKEARLKEKKLKSGFGKELLKAYSARAPVAQSDRASAF